MAQDNPTYTVSDVITDVNNRTRNPGLSNSVLIPWVSYAYNRLYNKILNVNQQIKEQLFSAYTTIPLVSGTSEYTITTYMPRYHSMIKVEMLYGATGDQRVTARKIPSIAYWKLQNQVSTSYANKGAPMWYILGSLIGFIPTPDGGTAYIWYVKRGTQLTEVADAIDIPYRYVYPVIDYVEAKIIARINEDYSTADMLERKFASQLEEVAEMVDGEYSEFEGNSIVDMEGGVELNPFAEP